MTRWFYKQHSKSLEKFDDLLENLNMRKLYSNRTFYRENTANELTDSTINVIM